ncbi:hypothetical protein PITCH_A640017 [uncultured Desulfobacterium sp.]|uniref:Uncharacterized protein n=1 Tax=uncultured Desulfobacterium sp. TaxID=201089 RepID=A0A445N159_9BACT|nr:hypothetical protein PITCH_A640017 [uncultured Desulfobacterium sp.]
MVVATWTPKKNTAAKLKNAAHATAIFGERTLVDITVAIELAASFIPFRKSKIRAMEIVIIIKVSIKKLHEN